MGGSGVTAMLLTTDVLDIREVRYPGEDVLEMEGRERAYIKILTTPCRNLSLLPLLLPMLDLRVVKV